MSEKKLFNYYRVQTPYGENVRYITDSTTKQYEEWGWTYEKLKVRRYDKETFKKVVKETLKENGTLGTTDLWKECLKKELLLQRETFLKRLRQIDDSWLQLAVVGNCYLWSVKE